MSTYIQKGGASLGLYIQCMLFTVLNKFFAEDALCASVP